VVGNPGSLFIPWGQVKISPVSAAMSPLMVGMGDNIRPSLYGAKYEAMLANKATAKNTNKVTIAGKFCESGDILIQDIVLPAITPGDILAVPDCGAYCLALASNYNASLKPAIVLVKDGKTKLIRRRETYEDLSRYDMV